MNRPIPGLKSRSDEWLKAALRSGIDESPDRDYFNQWTKDAGPTMNLPKIPYTFYYDDKYHWIMKDQFGNDRVVDSALWIKIFSRQREEVPEGLYFLGTTAVDQFYGEMRLCLELRWKDRNVTEVRLCAPDGDVIKSDIKQFHTSFDEAL